MIEREKFDRIKKEEIFLCVPVRNTQNLPRCALSWSWRYFWTRKINFICFHFWSTNFVFFFRDSRNKKSSNTFHKGQIILLFSAFRFKYHKILLFFLFRFSCQFLCQTFFNVFFHFFWFFNK